jgi:hypothetical protein
MKAATLSRSLAGGAVRPGWAAAHGVLAAGALAAAAIGVAVATGFEASSGMGYLAVPLLALGAYFFWRPAVYILIVMVLLEGIVRNWTDNPAVLLAKDAVLLGLYARALRPPPAAPGPVDVPRTGLYVSMAAFALLVLIQAFNPNIKSPLEAVVGLRTWLYYIPCFFVARALVWSTEDRDRIVSFLLITGVAAGLAGVYQYIAGPTAYMSLGPGFRGATFFLGGTAEAATTYRPNSTFAAASHFAMFLALTTLICCGAVFDSRGRRLGFLTVALGFLIGLNIIEGQRLVLVMLPALMLLMLIAVGRQLSPAMLFGAGAAALATVGLTAISQVGHLSLGAHPANLVSNQGEVFWTHLATLQDHVQQAVAASPYGLGSGATAIGARYVGSSIPLFVEFSWAKVTGDLSVLGLLIYAWVFVAIIGETIRRIRSTGRANPHQSRGVLAGILACQVLVAFVGYDLAVVGILFWFLTGLASTSARWTPATGGEN